MTKIKAALKNKQYVQATNLWGSTEDIISQLTGGVNWYNVMTDGSSQVQSTNLMSSKFQQLSSERMTPIEANNLQAFHEDDLTSLMNGKIKQKLGIIPNNVNWGGQSGLVFNSLSADFMLPVVDDVDYLLNRTNLKVVVYTGQLDLIVDTLGTLNWVRSLKWPYINEFSRLNKKFLMGNQGQLFGYKKSYKNFQFYWILKAGHMVPSDAGKAALVMLNQIIQN